jgi:hypothetical protein
VLESIVIQRSRKTCRELAWAAGKDLRFPQRRDPQTIRYDFEGEGKAYREVVSVAEKSGSDPVWTVSQTQGRRSGGAGESKKYDPTRILQQARGGIKLAAFLPGQYRLAGKSAT